MELPKLTIPDFGQTSTSKPEQERGFFEPIPDKVRARDFVRELPGSVAQIGQGIFRSAFAIGGKIGARDINYQYLPQGEFQQRLSGTDKPISFTSIGKETRFANEDSKTRFFDPIIGGIVAGTDILLGPGKRKAAEGVKDAVNISQDAIDNAMSKILRRFAEHHVPKTGHHITLEHSDDAQEYLKYMGQLRKPPTVEDVNRGLEILRLEGRQVDDIQSGIIKEAGIKPPAKSSTFVQDPKTGRMQGKTRPANAIEEAKDFADALDIDTLAKKEALRGGRIRIPQQVIDAGEEAIQEFNGTVRYFKSRLPKNIARIRAAAKTPKAPSEAFGVVGGLEENDEGEVEFDPIKATFGVVGMAAAKRFAPKNLEELKQLIAFKEEALENSPAKALVKYLNKRTGELPEVTGGKKSMFGSKGDDIASELGFSDSESARQAAQEYLRRRRELNALKQQFSTARKGELVKEKDRKVLNRFLDNLELKPSESRRTGFYDEFYKQNAEVTKTRTSIKEKSSELFVELKKGLGKALTPISTRLAKIDPSLKTTMRKFEYTITQKTYRRTKAVIPLMKGITKMSTQDRAVFELARKNGDGKTIYQIVSKYDLEQEYTETRKILDEIFQEGKQTGIEMEYRGSYFPRVIKDTKGFLNYLQGTDDWSIIQEAIEEKARLSGRLPTDFTNEEKASIANSLLRGYGNKISLADPGASKERTIDVVDKELAKFYYDTNTALSMYINTMTDSIEAKNFFGKGDGKIEDSIGSYVIRLIAEGKIKPSQEKELSDILKSRFNQSKMNAVLKTYKNLEYIDTMGSPISAITQLGDLAMTIAKNGLWGSIKSLGKQLGRSNEIKIEDLGIEKGRIAQEFVDGSTSGKAVDTVFKAVGLNAMDRLGKEVFINAALSRYRRMAKNPSKEFVGQLDTIFGSEAQSVVDDLKAGKNTENVKLLLFNDLLDVQPIALSEMPEMYLKHPNGRIFYMLKTYQIKLIDTYRREVIDKYKTDPKAAVIMATKLLASLAVMNATADEIKDFILNRETSLKDRTIDNIVKLAGFSKYEIYKAREEGLGSAAAKKILPPFKFIDSVYKDALREDNSDGLEVTQSVPVGGKLYYWWFGRGTTKQNSSQSNSSSSSADSLDVSVPEIKIPSISIPEIAI